MISSMTAFARVAGSGPWGSAVWELRSVNHRFLEVSMRLPEELRGLEVPARERIAQRLRRGKVDCSLRLTGAAATRGALTLDLDLARAVVAACTRLTEATGASGTPTAPDLLRWPGVVVDGGRQAEDEGPPLLALLGEALDELVGTRRREGERLAALIRQRLDEAEQHVGRVRAQLPGILRGLRDRLIARAAEISLTLDAGRLEQEVVLLAQRLDVAEELDRLEAHVAEVRRVLSGEEAVGRRLDFLMQELNREANTLGSKSQHVETTGGAVDLKVLIEQMREQVQNIE